MKTVNDLIVALKNSVHNVLNKDVTDFTKKHKIPLVGGVALVLLACVGILITYAYYQVTDITPIVGGNVGEIADIDIRIRVEARDDNGNRTGKYVDYAYIPKNKSTEYPFYEYNSEKSNCANGAIITPNEDETAFSITASGHDICYLYFDAAENSQSDLTLNVYIQKDGTDASNKDNYYLLGAEANPPRGYEINDDEGFTSCSNGLSISYIAAKNVFSISSTGKGKCDVYMRKITSDINLTILILDGEVSEIPKDKFYVIDEDNDENGNPKTSCTPTGSSVALSKQKVIISAGSPVSCVVTLKETTGPIIESPEVDEGKTTISFIASSDGTPISKWYYSTDGDTYTETTDTSIPVSDGMTTVWVYGVDSSNQESAVWMVDI